MKKYRACKYKKLLAAIAATGLLCFSLPVYALPQGGEVVTNNGQIMPGGTGELNITSSQGANVGIKWDSFDIAKGETLNFSGMNAALNYITGSKGSEIFGNLNAPGIKLFLINPNGILFGKDALVNVGSLTASTKKLSDVDTVINNFKNTGVVNNFGSAASKELVYMGELKADSLHLEGGRIILDTDRVKLSGSDFTGANAAINGDYDNGNVILGHTAYKNSSYENNAKTFTVSATDGSKDVQGYMWVENVEQLQNITTNLNGNYALKNDIDADGVTFTPIKKVDGSNISGLAGRFDGLGNSIKNLIVQKSSDNYVGLFGVLENSGKVSNVILSNGRIIGNYYVGGIVGYNDGGMITNVINGADVTGGFCVGGVNGYNGSGIIKGVTNKGKISVSLQCAGGIVGSNAGKGSVTDAKNYGEVTYTNGAWCIGGIIGKNTSTATVSNVYNSGDIMGTIHVGGIIGWNNEQVKITDAYNTKNVKGTENNNATGTGGIIGYTDAHIEISNVHNTGDVEGFQNVGGIVGWYKSASDAQLKNSYNKGHITGTQSVGGLIGLAGGAAIGGGGANGMLNIDTAYNTGQVEGNYSVGGIAGVSMGQISNAYNTGAVSGISSIGGIAGYAQGITINNVYNTALVQASGADTTDGCGGIIGFDVGNRSALTNAYYATTDAEGKSFDLKGYTKPDGSGKTYAELCGLSTTALGDSSGSIWKAEAGLPPILSDLLVKLTITVDGDITTVYNGKQQTVDAGQLNFDLEDIDYSRLHLNSYTDSGRYNLNDVIMGKGGGQDAYRVTVIGSGDFVIEKARLTIAVDDKTIAAGENLPGFTSTVSGFVNGESLGSLGAVLDYRTDANTAVAGDYKITGSLDKMLRNYDVQIIDGKLTIIQSKHNFATDEPYRHQLIYIDNYKHEKTFDVGKAYNDKGEEFIAGVADVVIKNGGLNKA